MTDRFPGSNLAAIESRDSTDSRVDGLERSPALEARALGATLSSLVRTLSVNPGMSELAMVEEVERQLTGTGCELHRVESMPGRPSLAAVLRGAHDGPALVLNGHIDTVAIDDRSLWSADPFGGEIRDGAVWGRGSVDMKGGLTAQIACARVLSELRGQMHGSLILHFAAGEECGEPGTLSLIEHGFVGDWGITTEPTNLEVATAERGTLWLQVRLHGRSVHAAAPQAGLNPIGPVEDVLGALRRYDIDLNDRRHPLLGHPICTVTMLQAGAEHNAVPDTCTLTIDRRMIPGETAAQVEAEVRTLVAQAVAAHTGIRAETSPIHHSFDPAEVASDTPFVHLVSDTVETVTGVRTPIIGTPYGSDVRNLVNDAGMEAITFGPGVVGMCHCPDEHLELEQLRLASVALTRVAVSLLAPA